MKKINNVKKFLAFFILVSIIYSLNFFPKFVGASFNDDILTSVETMPIIIDGNFSSIEDEWTNANSTEGFIDDLPIEIWVCYNKSNSSLYIAISIELEIHPSNEFLGIILCNSSNENDTEFLDAKIVQNYNLDNSSLHNTTYFDFHLVNRTNYIQDININGNGSCMLDEKKTKYEFEIKFNENNTDKQDVLLNISQTYAIKFIYGDNPNYNSSSSILKESTSLKIKIGWIEESEELPPDILELVINVLTIIFFISAGILYSYFGFYIFKTKSKLKRRRK